MSDISEPNDMKPENSSGLVLNIAALNELWLDRWPDCPPIAHELKYARPLQWVRFHTLPDAKRYADTEAEYLTILSRHNALLNELRTEAGGPIFVVTACGYGDTPQPQHIDPLIQKLLPHSVLWQVVSDDNNEDPGYTYIWAAVWHWTPDGLDSLLRFVADGDVSGVMIAPHSLDWIYHPYDGGADVIASDSESRTRIERRHAGWLSTHPSGL